jgi:hypothetical protein
MNRRTLILSVTASAAVALGGLTTLTHSHAQTSPSATHLAATTTAAVAPTTEAATRGSGASSEASRFWDRRGGSSEDRGSSRRFGSSTSSSFPVHELTGTKYADLETRSIFVKGYYRHGSDSRESRGPTTTYAVTPPNPEHTLVFEGATEFDYDYVAFIEDQSTMKVMMLKSGDPVGRGRVGQITLNYMDYVDKAGKTVKVAIGKNLEGMDPPSTQPTYTSSYSSSPYSSSSSSSSSYSSPSSPSSSSPGSSSVSPSSGGIMSPADAAAERLRRRRQAELGGGGR